VRQYKSTCYYINIVRILHVVLCICTEYDKLMAEGGTGDFFYIRYMPVIIKSLLLRFLWLLAAGVMLFKWAVHERERERGCIHDICLKFLNTIYYKPPV